MLLKDQSHVTPKRGMPVHELMRAHSILDVSSETVQLYYFSSGVATVDAGQAAGTVVVAKLAYGGIMNEFGDQPASYQSTSLSFTSSDLTSQVEFPGKFDAYDGLSLEDRANAITNDFTNGQWCLDPRYGILYAKKASTGTTLTATSYKIPGSFGAVGVRDDALTTSAIPEGGPMGFKFNAENALWVELYGSMPGDDATNGLRGIIDKLIGASTYTPDVYVSSALEDDALLTSNEANVFRASGYIDETAPSGLYWVFLLDSGSAPTNGAVTHLYPPIPVVHTINTPSTWDFTQILGRNGLHASNGVAVALSDTPISLTLSGDYLRVGGLTKDA